MNAPTSKILVSDFDGTMTRRDFYQLVAERLLPPGTPEPYHDPEGDPPEQPPPEREPPTREPPIHVSPTGVPPVAFTRSKEGPR